MKSEVPNITGNLITGGAALLGATIGALSGLLGGRQSRKGAQDLVLYTHLQDRRQEVLASTYEQFHELHKRFAELLGEPERFPDPTRSSGGPINSFSDEIDAFGQKFRSQALWLPEETANMIRDHRQRLSDRVDEFKQIIHERESVHGRGDFEGGPMADLRWREQHAAKEEMKHLYQHFRAVLRADDERANRWSSPALVLLIVLLAAIFLALIALLIVFA